MRFPALAAAAAALLSLALPAAAQDAPPPADVAVAAVDTTPPTSLRKGAWSLSFAAPGTGGERTEFGAWEMVGTRTNLGLTLGLSITGQDAESGSATITEAATAVDVGVNLKRYVMEPREVTPFLLGSVVLGGAFQRRDGPGDLEGTTRSMNAGVRAAVGVEWFPVPRFSVSGHTGFSLTGGTYNSKQDYPDNPDQEADGTTLTFRSVTSALTVQIYF
ncbi:MAG TPA: hypothetical protein VEQ60_14530 [Longimicrobium sp.]|nr:hypothetical protein [Longimicrobium sp.]